MKKTNGIGARLKRLRVERDLTLKQLASLVGVTIGTIWSIEQGRTGPNDRTLHKIQKVFPSLLLEGEPPAEQPQEVERFVARRQAEGE